MENLPFKFQFHHHPKGMGASRRVVFAKTENDAIEKLRENFHPREIWDVQLLDADADAKPLIEDAK